MESLPGGTFQMGDSIGDILYAYPVHAVAIRPFKLGKYEVTYAQWDACVEDGGCGGYRPDDAGRGRGNRPVDHVSWNDAHLFIDWLNSKTDGGYRLPTEAEWEYAARAGSTTRYSWGDDVGQNRANCDHDCGDQWRHAAPVGSFPANAWGLHDMHGNVFEYAQDCRNDSYMGAPSDGSAWESGNCDRRMLQGGGWTAASEGMCSACRHWRTRTARTGIIGFRLAQDQ